MANRIITQKLVDTNRRALIKIVLMGDGTAESNTTIIDAGSLAHALNVNNLLLGVGTDRKAQYRTTIKRIFGQAKTNGYFHLSWTSDNNVPIVTMSDGSFDYNFENLGDGAVIPAPEGHSNATGNIAISTTGVASADALTVFVDLRKNGEDYNQGQINDPVAFNKR